MIKKMALLFVLAGTTLNAGEKIDAVEYIGLGHLSVGVAEEIAGIGKGDEIDLAKINASVKKFFALGYFKDVWVEKKDTKIIYHFQEKLAISNIEVKGFGSDDDTQKLLDKIGLKKGDLYDESKIKEAKKSIIASLEEQGYYDSVVEISSDQKSKNSIALKFEVNKGEKIIVRKINFIGIRTFEADKLQSLMANKERDSLGWFPFGFNDGVAKVDQLELDSFRAKEIYMQNGYLDAEVGKPLMRVDFGSYNAMIDYLVSEGTQYKVGDVSLALSLKGIDSVKVAQALRLKKGMVFDIERMRSDMQMIKESVGNLGYAFAKVYPNMHKDDHNHTVNLQYMVESGDPVTINDVIISGNDVTKDRVIRRYIYLAPGDKYNETDLKESKGALGRTGYFEKIDIETQRVSQDKINLLVKVKEASTGTISAGGGYGQYEGFMFNASVSDKNILGSGVNGSLGFDISKISTNYNLSFTNPRLWDSMYSLGVDLYKRDYEYIDYTQDQLGGSVNIGKLLDRHLYGSVGIGYVDNQSSINNDYNTTINDIFYSDKYKKASLFATLKYDNTDDFYVPREGYIALGSVELANMNGDITAENQAKGYKEFAKYAKFSAKFGAFNGLEKTLDYDLVLRYKARLSVISANDEYIPIGEKLFIGGMGSVRGYNAFSLSPLYESRRIGGTYSFSNALEASIPLSEETKMRLAFFVDWGTIGTRDLLIAPSNKVSVDEISRSSSGAVLEWQSPFGPLNLIFAKAINPSSDDSTAFFEFSMGSNF